MACKATIHRAAALVGLLVACGAAGPARAEAPRSAYRLSVGLDVPLLLITGGVAASFLVLNEGAPPHCAPLCDRSDINAFDRHFAGYYDQGWRTTGNVTMVAVFALVPTALLVAEPSRAGLSDLLVVGETVLLVSSIQVLASYAVGRPRPYVYGEEAPLDERTEPNARRSFFSGHVANTLAAGMVASLAIRRAGHPRLAWATLGVGIVGSALVGVSRVASGGHFPTDVVVGFAVGAGAGIAIPALHDLNLQAAPLVAPGAGGLSLTGRF